MRKTRKNEHIENCLKAEYIGETLFEDIYLEHNPLPELALEEIDTRTEFLGKPVSFPLIINSMTGGSEMAEGINRELASLAAKYGLPMAVGSQQIIFEDEDSLSSFTVVREVMGEEGIIIGNLGASCTMEEFEHAVDLIAADAMQIHLNPAQELVMEDGDRDFRGWLANIQRLAEASKRPMILKEVGYGIPKSTGDILYDAGVRIIDIAGFGGTNFTEIENLRAADADYSDLYCWGNPTAKLLLDYRQKEKDLQVIASGGVKTGLDIVKAFVLGADMIGISGEILNYLIHGGIDNADRYLQHLIYKTRAVMLLVGARNLEELADVRFAVTGKLRQLTDPFENV